MHRYLMLACAGAIVLFVGGATAEQANKPATQPAPAAQAPAAPAKFVPPIRGSAELGVLKPVTKRVGKEIVTTIKVKNLSATGAIAGLKLDEFWYDKGGSIVTGDTYRHRKLLLPGEVIDITLRTPADPRMHQNQYNFSHANGNITAKSMQKF